MINTFYKGLSDDYSLVLNGSTSPFAFLKVVITQNIETIRDFRKTDQAAFLKLIVEDLEKDVGEWYRLNSSDLSLLVEEEIKRLSDHMHKTYTKAQQALEGESKGLKFLMAEMIKIADAIDASNNALADANERLEKA